MKKNIIISLALITILVSGCSIPFLSKKTETVKCSGEFIGKYEVEGKFEDDKLINMTFTQIFDVSTMTSEEKEELKSLFKMSDDTKFEEKDGSLIATTIEEPENDDIKSYTKEEFKKEMINEGLKCE